MKTHFKKLRNTNYIGGWDFVDGDKTVTITTVDKEKVHDGKGGESECCIVHFAEIKPMVANATNLKRIAKILGSPFIEDWANKQIVLTTEKVKAFGEIHDAVRVSLKPAEKPTLIANSDDFKRCVDYLAKGGKIDALKKRFVISTEMEAALTNDN